jgi:ankyrin repeat protein
MARLIITRCFKSYDINAHGGICTPLTAAIRYDDEELLRLLCERADVLVDKQDGNGETALYGASVYGLVECMRILLDVGEANINALNDRSWTALHCAALYGRLEAAVRLIERGAKINAVDAYGWTPLDRAQSKVEMIAFLKSKGRSVEVSCSLPPKRPVE